MTIANELEHPARRPLRFAVTGASGFIGSATVRDLRAAGHYVRPIVRSQSAREPGAVAIQSIGPETDWSAALHDIDVVIHCAAAIPGRSREPDLELNLRRVNVEGSVRLAVGAAESGVKRLVFLSSIGVMGNSSPIDQPIQPSFETSPHDAYSRSKAEAEDRLRQTCTTENLELVVVRPPLVYGPGARGTFALLVKAVRLGVPLPIRNVANSRSYIGVRNLADFLRTCSLSPDAAGRTFHVSDCDDLSTEAFVRLLASSLSVQPRTFHINDALLRVAAKAVGLGRQVQSLTASLRVDSSLATEVLGWQPPYSVADELSRLAASTSS